jgi:hypothetical protein
MRLEGAQPARLQASSGNQQVPTASRGRRPGCAIQYILLARVVSRSRAMSPDPPELSAVILPRRTNVVPVCFTFRAHCRSRAAVPHPHEPHPPRGNCCRRDSRRRGSNDDVHLVPDSARVSRATRWARLIGKPCRRVFVARPLPVFARPASDARPGLFRSGTR